MDELIAAGLFEDELEVLDAVPLELLDDFGPSVRFGRLDNGECEE
jgi:hypothetical protein